MKLSKYKYDFPEELLAQYPAKHRDESRLMVLHRKTKKIEHKIFTDIIDYFDEKDIFIFNNTKVFPARLFGNKEKTGAKIEVFLLRELSKEQKLWDVLVDPARKIRIGNKLYFGDNDMLVAEVIDNTTSRGRTLRFLYDGPYDELKEMLYNLGKTPLPQYIKRMPEPIDDERYQTIMAKHEGAVAAPSAGLHFSKHLLKRFEIKGIENTELTLHIGLGSFRNVDVEDLTKHKMDSEQAYISEQTAAKVNESIEQSKQICAVGTSVVKALESSVSTDGYLKPFDGWTNKFIFPIYNFGITTSIVTNFHQPLSTLLMTISAFAGYDFLFEAYEIAIKEKYRFGAYGDAMLIL